MQTTVTGLDRLLQTIDPERTLDEVDFRVDAAVNSFNANAGMIAGWQEFKTCMARFFRHLENSILRFDPPYPLNLHYDWGRCCHLILEEYGTSGEKVAFEMARTGVKGGLYSVLKAVARRMTNQYARSEISARIYRYWDGLTVDEQLAVSTEYLEKWGHLLPSEMTEGCAMRIRANIVKVLQEHPRVLQRLGRVGR